jgi:homoserine kinase
MRDSIRVFASATVANVACGFDILGFAVDNPGDEVILRFSDKPGVRIVSITGDEGRLSYDAEQNTVGVPVLEYLKKIGSNQGVEITLNKKMPFGSGLGSSAASAVAGAFAINELMGKKLSKVEILQFAMQGEKAACGTAHADNVAPSLFGGFVLVRSYEPLDVIEIPTPSDLFCTIIHPHIEVKTKDARDILRKQVQLKDAVIQWGNVAGLMAGLMKNDYALIGRSMQDVIVEPIRSILIPGYMEVKQSALDAGVLGAGISGSGPSIFALSTTEDTARHAGEMMKKVFDKYDIGSQVYVSTINQSGPLILD